MTMLNITESQILELILSKNKVNDFQILEVETGTFEDNQGEQKRYARLVVCDKEEWKLLDSVGLVERAEKIKFPVVQYDGSDLTDKVGKSVKASKVEQWFLRKSKVDVGFGRQETQIVGIAYKMTMQELATL
ncbi:hypothetical protein M5P26_10950 [Streptococcus suis]|uniref:hypothetical protein n=2 Tax=Streptococcus suis TaxID=1307 RepID=UPI00201AA5B4|nr:hypothetical protein [Streptococcus suis]MCL4948041.1 hypothetical protein [Streptococcus suis]